MRGIRAGRFRIAAGLLIMLRLTSAVRAQDTGGPRVEVRTSPELPLAGSAWTVTLLVDHPIPEEVTVLAPPFEKSLSPDQTLKGPYTGGPAAVSGRPWTIIEYRFVLHSPGVITLGPFTVSAPKGQTRTPPLVITVRNPREGASARRFRLAWDGFPSSLRAGEAATFSLRASGWDSRRPLPEPERFMTPVPEGVILEAERPALEERASGVVLKLNVIPLDATALVLSGGTILFGNDLFEIPPLRLPVIPAPERAAAPDNGERSGGAEMEEAGRGDPVPFPELESVIRHHPILQTLFRGGFENIYDTAKNLWDRGCRPEALAKLRQNERDHPAGPLFLSLRKAAELSIGLDNTGDEKSRYTHIMLFLVCLAAALVCARLSLPFGGKKAGLACVILFAGAGILCLYRFAAGGGTLPGRSLSGVLKETVVRRVPDLMGEAAVHFREGQPVRLPPASKRTGSWVWVTAYGENGAAGWAPEDTIVLY